MTDSVIEDKLLAIIEEKMKVDKNLLKDNCRMPLTGYKFHFSAMDLIYLFYEVEKEFGCSIKVENICHYEFNTIQGIIDIINDTKPNETSKS